MIHRFYLSVVATAIFANQSCLACTTDQGMPANNCWAWVGSISAGPVWAGGGKTQSFYLTPAIEKTYAANTSTNTLVAGELFVGLQSYLFASQWLGQVGLALATTGNAKLQGEIWDDADPQFNNYSYQYNVRNSRIAVKGNLLLADEEYWVMPWISASLGAGLNRASNYTNTRLIFEAVPNANFTDKTQTSFTYTLGVGLQKAIDNHWQAGLGYEFADWGQSELGRAAGQTLNTGITLNHFYTNGVLFNITYIA